MRIIEEVKRWVCEITEIALLLVALGIVFEILFGGAVPFFGGTSVVTNLTNLISSLGDNGLVGLVALGVIIYLFNKRPAMMQQQHHQ
jgi:hypothetical protein